MSVLPPKARRERGFTLIELCAAMVVMTILTVIAVSTYTKQTQKSRRTEATQAVMELASREEQLYSTINTYSSLPTDLGYSGASFPITVGSGYYTLTVVVAAATAATPATFTVTATATGSQTGDTACTSFSVNQLGQQSATGASPSTCW